MLQLCIPKINAFSSPELIFYFFFCYASQFFIYTPETINSVELYEWRSLRDAYVKAYEGKLTEQEVDERLVAAEFINVQVFLLLRDDGLYKKLAGHIKMREGLFEAAWNGAVRDRLNKNESSLGMRLIYSSQIGRASCRERV